MSNMIIPWQGNLPAERTASRELAQSVAGMQAMADVAMLAMEEVSAIQKYAAQKVAATLADAALSKQILGDVRPEQQAYFDYAESVYLRTVGRITATASQRIALAVDQVPSRIDRRRGVQRVLDDIWDTVI